ncbi:MAG: hypothetical protein AB7S26_12125 [Sandaracinaceae bacterium]
MSIEPLLDGHSPTEAWLATDDAARMLSDPVRRSQLYRAMHPQADAARGPLLRALLGHEVAFRTDDHFASHDEHEDRFENLYWCALLLSQIGEVQDVLALWRAKMTNFDTGCGFDVQFLVGAGVEPTLAFLTRSEDPVAPQAAEWIKRCAELGEFDWLDEWLAWRREYFASSADEGSE